MPNRDDCDDSKYKNNQIKSLYVVLQRKYHFLFSHNLAVL